MSSQRTTLIVAGLVAVITVSAASFVVAQDRTTTIKRITDASPAAPGMAWTTDVSESGLDGAVFADPRTGSMFSWGAGSIRIDDTLLTLAVVPDDLTTSSDAVMMSIDAATGDLLWTAPADDVAACADQPLDGRLVCQIPTFGENPGLLTFDVATGESHHYESAPDIFAATVANGSVYVAEGNLEDADVMLHRGTLDDYDADWSVGLDVWAGWEDQYADQLVVGEDSGHFDLGGDFSTFDAQTGNGLWSTDILDDCLIAQYRTLDDVSVASNFDCDGDSSIVTGTTAYTSDGTVLATSSGPAIHYLSIDEPSDVSVPVVLGDGAFDRRTGEQLWRSDELTMAQPATEWTEETVRGTLVAVVGDVGVMSGDARLSGLDLRSGEQLWSTEGTGSILARDGDRLLVSGGGNLGALDVRTGEQLWSAEYSKMTPDESTTLDTAVDAHDGTYLLQSGSTLARLEPLPT